MQLWSRRERFLARSVLTLSSGRKTLIAVNINIISCLLLHLNSYILGMLLSPLKPVKPLTSSGYTCLRMELKRFLTKFQKSQFRTIVLTEPQFSSPRSLARKTFWQRFIQGHLKQNPHRWARRRERA